MAIVEDVRARFSAEIKGVRKAFQELRQEAKKLAPDVQKSTEKAGDGYVDLIKTTERLKKSIEESGGDADLYRPLQSALEDVQREMEETGKVSADSMDRLQREVKDAGDLMDTFGNEAAGNLDEFRESVRQAERALGELGAADGLEKVGREADQVTDKVEAIGDSDGLDNLKEDAEGAEKALGGLGGDKGVLGGVIKKLGAFALAGGAVAGVGGAFMGVVKSGDELGKTMANLQASTGASNEEMDEMKGILRDIYANNYGDSFDDIAESMTSVRQITGATGEELQALSQDALMLRSVFGYEVQESTRAANVLMKQFGIEGREAMALIAEGTQEGLNYADDLLDTINEYSVYYEQAGFSAQEMFGMFKNAQETGAFNLDYAGDAFKEFTIIMQEDSERAKDALDSIGLDGAALREQFSKGGEDARQAFQTITEKLAEVEDPLQQNIAGVELFGTKFEDLGAAAVVEMSKTNDSIEGSAETLESINEIKFSSISGAIQGMGRTLMTEWVLPLQDKLMPAINKGAKAFTSFVKSVSGALSDLSSGEAEGILKRLGLDADQFKPVLTFISTLQENLSRMGDNILPVLERIGGVILDTLVDIWPTVRDALGAALSFIGGIFQKIAAFWESDGKQFADAVVNAFNLIKSVVEFVMPFILGIIKTIWGNITGIINGALNIIMGAVKIFSGLFTGDFAKMWEGVKQLFAGAIEFIWNWVQLTFFGRILKGAGTFAKGMKDGLAAMWTAIKTLFTGGVRAAWELVKKGWDDIAKATKDVYTNIANFLKNTWNSIKSITSGVISGLRTLISGGWNFIRNTTTTVFNAIRNFLTSTWNTIRNFLSTTVSNIRNFISSGWSSVRDTTTRIFSQVWNAIRNAFTSAWNFVKSTATNIKNWVSDTWNALKNNTTKTFKGIYDEIVKRFNNIVDRAKELPKKIGDGIGAMASKVTAGVTKVINSLASTLGKGINGVIGGINWVLGKIGVSFDVPTWTVPQYAKGTDGHPGGLAIVGDGKGANAGRELVRTPDGDLYLSPAKDTLVDLPRGTEVVSAKNTRKLLEGLPRYQNGIGDTLTHLWKKGKGWVKGAADKVLDVFSYLKNPGKLLDIALSAIGVSKPGGGNFIGEIARGAWDLVKNGAVSYVKKMLTEFGGGDALGFGRPFRRSSKYGYRNHPISGGRKMHWGDDWAAPRGTPIPAQAAGVVTFSGYHPIRGNYVRVRSGNYERIYQHNSRNAVFGGQQVRKGQIIGYVGSTGSSTGPHLHYEVLRNGSHINPAGHKDGGIVTSKTLSWLAEGGWAESVISHDPAKRGSQKAIWQETGRQLNFFNDLPEGAANMPLGDLVIKLVADGHELAEVVEPWLDLMQGNKTTLRSAMSRG